LRDEKAKVLRAFRQCTESVRGSTQGTVEEGVAPGSQTPTYAALQCFVDNWRWQDVPLPPLWQATGSPDDRDSHPVEARPHAISTLVEAPIAPNLLSLSLQQRRGASAL